MVLVIVMGLCLVVSLLVTGCLVAGSFVSFIMSLLMAGRLVAHVVRCLVVVSLLEAGCLVMVVITVEAVFKAEAQRMLIRSLIVVVEVLIIVVVDGAVDGMFVVVDWLDVVLVVEGVVQFGVGHVR